MSIRHASLMAEAAGIVEQNTPFAQRPSKLAAELRQARDEIVAEIDRQAATEADPDPLPGPLQFGRDRTTLWDQYAMAAVAGCIAGEGESLTGSILLSRRAADYADAMMAERAKRGIGS